MTVGQRRALDWAAIAAIAAIFGAGTAWATEHAGQTALAKEVRALREDVELVICHLEPTSLRCQRREGR